MTINRANERNSPCPSNWPQGAVRRRSKGPATLMSHLVFWLEPQMLDLSQPAFIKEKEQHREECPWCYSSGSNIVKSANSAQQMAQLYSLPWLFNSVFRRQNPRLATHTLAIHWVRLWSNIASWTWKHELHIIAICHEVHCSSNFFKYLKAQNPLIEMGYSHPFPPPTDLWKSCRRGDEKTVRARGDGGVQENKAF